MTEDYWELFCVSHLQLAPWCNGYDSVGCEFEYINFSFGKGRRILIGITLNSKYEKPKCFVSIEGIEILIDVGLNSLQVTAETLEDSGMQTHRLTFL